MASTKPKALIAVSYEHAARDYLSSLPLEHFMEATAQATQRKITLESLDLVAASRSDVHIFNELLVQYPVPGQRKPGQVVPDNMVVISDQPVEAETSFNLPLEPAPPFWVLEYVSKSNKRKDYEENFDKYERDLKVPYYLTFYPDNQELTLYRHTGKKYLTVKPNKHGRYAIPELDLEVGLLDGWVRYWHNRRLLPLPPQPHANNGSQNAVVQLGCSERPPAPAVPPRFQEIALLSPERLVHADVGVYSSVTIDTQRLEQEHVEKSIEQQGERRVDKSVPRLLIAGVLFVELPHPEQAPEAGHRKNRAPPPPHAELVPAPSLNDQVSP